jgi:DNA mismatch endonuclease, patch repair protein
MDIFAPDKRSDIMSRIRGSGTKPEITLYSMVKEIVHDSLGCRRRVLRNARHIKGTPDVYVPSLRLVFFVDGCFFHGCPIHGRLPSTNTDYWHPKIEATIRRDRLADRSLRRAGFSVWRFWEHALRAGVVDRAAARAALAVRRAVERNSCPGVGACNK